MNEIGHSSAQENIHSKWRRYSDITPAFLITWAWRWSASSSWISLSAVNVIAQRCVPLPWACLPLWQEGLWGTRQTVASILQSCSSLVPCPWFRHQAKEATTDQMVQATCHGRENVSAWDTMTVKTHSCRSLLPSSRWQWPLTYSWEVTLTYTVFCNHVIALLPVEKTQFS